MVNLMLCIFLQLKRRITWGLGWGWGCLLKHWLLDLTCRVLFSSASLDGTEEFLLLTSYQVMLIPLLQGTNFKNHSSSPKVLSPKCTVRSPETLDQVNKNARGGGMRRSFTWTWSTFLRSSGWLQYRGSLSPWPGHWPTPIDSTVCECYEQACGHSATSGLCLSFIIHKIMVIELLRILNRIINKRTQGNAYHIVIMLFITFVADITGNKIGPVFPAIKRGQVKDN